jgi:hypothetical protein
VRDTHILICEKRKRALGLEIAVEARVLGQEEAAEARGSSGQRRRRQSRQSEQAELVARLCCCTRAVHRPNFPASKGRTQAVPASRSTVVQGRVCAGRTGHTQAVRKAVQGLKEWAWVQLFVRPNFAERKENLSVEISDILLL